MSAPAGKRQVRARTGTLPSGRAGPRPQPAATRREAAPAPAPAARPSWTFLTNHAHVLLCLSREPEVRMREIAERVGITERAVQRIVANLEEAGHLVRIRQGRRNHYRIRAELPLRHPIERHVRVSALLDFVLGEDSRAAAPAAAPRPTAGGRAAPARSPRARQG